MREPSISKGTLVASITLMIGVWLSGAAMAQMDDGPKTEKTYGIGLPRDTHRSCFPRTIRSSRSSPGQEAYADIDGARMKKDSSRFPDALRYRDTVNKQWWGSFPAPSLTRPA